MAKPGKTGLSRIFDATGYSLAGLKAAWHNEAAFRQELLMVLALTPLAFWVSSNLTQTALLLASLYLILLMELANSALEAVVDRISDEHHPLSGRAKDIGSAMVFVSLIGAATVWLLVILD
nr:diacylglycerol kinase [uncultured Desulfuromonas sp.]